MANSSPTPYSELDAAILKAITEGHRKFSVLRTAVESLAAPHAKKSRSPYVTPPWRIVDRRLQALRKSGRIAYTKGEWHVVV